MRLNIPTALEVAATAGIIGIAAGRLYFGKITMDDIASIIYFMLIGLACAFVAILTRDR